MSRSLVANLERFAAFALVVYALLAVDDHDDVFVLGIVATPFLALGVAYLLAERFERK